MNCRGARARRQRRLKAQEEHEQHDPAGAREIADIVRHQAPDIVHHVLKSELRPIVRDAITEDVLRSISDMVGLTPRAVQLLAEDMEHDDAVIRQRAYTLVAKYTLGHPALVKAEDADGSKQIVVNFNLPRPEDGAVTAEVEEDTVECDTCHEDKLASEMVSGSTRCQACHDKTRAEVLARFE